jgi:Lrp/AsnC family leucine-responsive transcriptional regulator
MHKIDAIDTALVNLLQEDASRTLAELGKAVGLSITAVKERLKQLRTRGNIRGYVALIEPQNLGYKTCAFVYAIVEGKKNEAAFLKSILKIPEIEECHNISGEFPYLLKVWAHDLQHLDRLLNETVKKWPGVVRIQTAVVLSSAKDRVTGLPAGLNF